MWISMLVMYKSEGSNPQCTDFPEGMLVTVDNF